MSINLQSPYRSFLLVCFVLLNYSAFSQDIIGKVRDKRTSDSLVNVKVYWRNDLEYFVVTNNDGIYRIEKIPDAKILVFEMPGKERREVPIEKIKNNEYDATLENVGVTSVTASRWEQSVYEIPASTVIMTREEIERNGYLTLQEVLENVPGYYTIDHRSESDVTLGVRGFWAPFNRNVMIQVNGVNMLSERQNDFPLNKINIPVEAIERIEIVRGPLSVVYGAGAFFGVINIITINPDGTPANSQVSTGYGSQNAFKQFARYSMNKDGFVLSLNAMSFVREGFVQAWDDMVSDSTYNAYANAFNVSAPMDTMTIDQYRNQMVNKERYSRRHQSFNMSLSYNKLSANINYARSDFGFSFLHPGPSQRNSYISNTMNAQVRVANTSPLKRFNYEVKLAHMFSLVDATYKYFLPESYTPGEDRVASLRSEANVRWRVDSKGTDSTWNMYLSGGLAYTNNYQNSSIYNAAEFGLRNWYIGLKPETNLSTVGAYGQTEIKLKDLQILAGGRLERQGAYELYSAYNLDYEFVQSYYDTSVDSVVTDTLKPTILADKNSINTRINFIPRLAFIYTLDNWERSTHYLRLIYGSAIKQAPVVDNASDILMVYDGPNYPYLLPERIRTFEFGYTYRFDDENYQQGMKKLFVLNANIFRNKLFDLITRRAEIVNGQYQSRSYNGGVQVTHGIEFIGNLHYKFPRSKDVREFMFTSNSYITYQQTKNIDTLGNTNDNVSFSPNFLAGANVSLTLNRPRNRNTKKSIGNFVFTIGFNYVGAMNAHYESEFTGDQNNPIPPHFIGAQTDDYFRWTVNMRINDIHFKPAKDGMGGFYVNLKIANIFDKKYNYPTYTINPWADKGIAGRPRQLLLTLGYKF